MIITGYFDTSGKHPGSTALAVGGFLARSDEWGAFEYEWTEALASWSLDAFHMSDFVGRRRAFETWSDVERRERLAILIAIINRHVLGSVGVMVPFDLYRKHFPDDTALLTGGPYAIAGMVLWQEAADLAASTVPDAEVAYVYEQGDEGAGQFLKLFQDNYRDPAQRARYRLLSMKFEDKRRFVPLQAADILAYELWRDVARYLRIEKRDRRWPLQAFWAKPNSWTVVGEENMVNFGRIATLGIEHSIGTWNKSKLSPRRRRRSRRKSKHDH